MWLQCVVVSQLVVTDLTLEYSHDRTAFGKPLHQLQKATQLKLAEMATDLEAAKLLTLKAAQMKDQGDNFISAASMAKLLPAKHAIELRPPLSEFMVEMINFVKDNK